MLGAEMMLSRRALVQSGVVGASALALPGCATVAPTTQTRRACTPRPVNVSAGRIIRTVAGLRPYRAEGFVVRAEVLGDKRIVHNYGHGGGGITLSWGSSRLAVDMGLPGHQGVVAVIGAGILGLTTARLLQEAGFDVTLYTEALPPNTTSNIAGGQWSPYSVYDRNVASTAFRDQLKTALVYSWRRFQIMVGDDYGVHWVTTYTDHRETNQDRLPFQPDQRLLDASRYPFPVEQLYQYQTMYVETGRFLRELMKDIHIAGGHFVIRRFATPADIAALNEKLIFNCTGLGSRALFGDTQMYPRRGQLAILLPQPEIDYAFTGDMGYMFPRADGILLGGTNERDVWDATPQPADIAHIIESHQRFFGGFRCPA